MGDVASKYKDQVTQDIASCISKMGCQPILFLGSGLSKRYFDGPSWDELLGALAKKCPLIDKEYAYYKQTLSSHSAIGEQFADLYQQWAWGTGKNQFPSDMFSENVPKHAYIKYIIAQYLVSLTPSDLATITDNALVNEIHLLQAIKPHALITTNYDKFLELAFPEYQPVIGQQLLHSTQVLFGEIFKIHGCVSDYESLVFTDGDYQEFTRKKKYLSAKLLTYFSEHPLLFVGYSATDPNIRSILSDIDECLPRRESADSLIPNIFFLEWKNHVDDSYVPATEKLISIDSNKSVRIKSIETDDFSWVFAAFGQQQPLNAVSPKILRALLHRSYDLVRHDIPRTTVQADFQMLAQAVKSGPEFAKLFGITTVSSPSLNSIHYPYTITELAEKLSGGSAYWAVAQSYLDRIKTDHGVDIKKSDNTYHCATKTGKKSTAHKYSDALFEILTKMKIGEPYVFSP
jgi:hypothetical protein